MIVYVLNKIGKALMPTTPRKSRLLLKQKKAKVVTIKPFTIQLIFGSSGYKQDITLGIDSGYNNVGFSAVTEKKELIVGELTLLQGMKERLLEKSRYRKIRRSRLRHRKTRWSNRTKSKPKGWLAPSLQHKLDSHIKFIDSLYKILPITKCIIEVASFDIQKMKNDNISGVEYQQGDMMAFWNTREYVLHRDNHKCQNPNCKNKGKEQILEVHHIKFKSHGGTDSPSNLITLCNKCHTSPNHKKGKFLYDWCMEGKKVRGFKDATFMSMIRWYLVNKLKENHSNIETTYGYITKNHRIENKIEKTHYNDAFAIVKGINQVRNSKIFEVKQVRRNNRSLEKFYDSKYIDIRTGEKVSGGDLNNGRRTRNKNLNSENLHQYRGKKLSKGQRRIRKVKYFYQPNDLVNYEGKIYSVKGTQNGGAYIRLNEIKKVPRVDLLTPYKFMKGFVYGLYIKESQQILDNGAFNICL
ncbi:MULTISPECIES: RNA-guided endonuclease IscB [unclassified Clostridium]|uniref:RNA-guided endonuclease IscB n=1 Tax=unclassified Clostridium TaxID=2614128 RepID=UPI00215AD738|nr:MULTISPECIES: RNA-guided endonuclease IscB [unclassified Clostridium]